MVKMAESTASHPTSSIGVAVNMWSLACTSPWAFMACSEDLESKVPTTLPQQPSLSKPEKSALRSLRNNHNILIFRADRGNTTVIFDKDDYIVEADQQLSDRSIYQLLTSNPTQSYNQELHHLISTAGPSQGLSKTDISLLLNSQPCTPPCTFCLKYTNQVIPAIPLSLSMTLQPNVFQRASMPTSNPLSNPPLPCPGYQPFFHQYLIPTYTPPPRYHHGHC